jgi:hypothetical protein
MSYEYDVFLSYRRHGEWPSWVRVIFMPLFSHWLGEELGRDAKVFVDYEIETGDSWPQKLGKSLGETRVLVALFSRQYFASPWCMRELQHVLSREQACGFRTAQNPAGLIVPASIHDGKDFPHRSSRSRPPSCRNTRAFAYQKAALRESGSTMRFGPGYTTSLVPSSPRRFGTRAGRSRQ